MRNLILRNTPDIADMFELRTIESANGLNTYELFCENKKIVLCGDCKISQAMAYYEYLKKYCGVNISHCGNRDFFVDSAPLFEGKITKIIKQKKRAFMNYCTFGYSFAYWKWDRWEKEIDFMAMNGINMPLSVVGSEAVWYYTMRDLTYSETGALSFLSGPGFWPWQLMGNITGYFSLTDVKYIESRLELGKKIIEREVELGMTPIQQGFAGTVPPTLSKLFKKLRLRFVPSWCNFPITYQLEPTDPLFKKFGTALLEKQRQLFGAYHYYACDPFHENIPSVKTKDYLWKVGRAIDTMYQEFDKESVWVMQSWSLREQIVKAVPKERLLILDLDGSKYKETENFWGYDFILGNIHNFGDRNTLHGSIKALADNEFSTLECDNCVGTGLFPEGVFQNPLYYDLAFQMLTEDGAVDLDEWLRNYAYRRYGSKERCLVDAMMLLKESCYSENCTGRETGSIICARPGTELLHTAPNDVRELRYDNKTLYKAAELLLSAENATKDGYAFDACDLVRQVMSNYVANLYDKVMYGYENKDVNIFERSSNAFLKICTELDELLQTRPELTLHEHLKEANELALNDKDKENFELNLLAQITVWGPISDTVNYDYAWKEWGGMIKTYYIKRWQSFFELLAYEFPKRRLYSTTTKKQHCERNLYRGNQFYKNYADFEKKWLSNADPEAPSNENTVETARRMLEKYKRAILED
ncbi:MAG: alpha-N-acetylglucosaminidase TIM-barrel domain-containing protein [Acutalibacteraceae bacterium]|nr:alpha-N-acetylglucosaminidase TIM-barrel domain-containing protein [Acutalibacteraceae bacterium]